MNINNLILELGDKIWGFFFLIFLDTSVPREFPTKPLRKMHPNIISLVAICIERETESSG